MQSNKTSSKKTRKTAEASNAAPEITSPAPVPTPKPRATRSSTVKKSETSETAPAKRHRKPSSPSVESAPATKTMAASAVESAPIVVPVVPAPAPVSAPLPEPPAVVLEEKVVLDETPTPRQVTHEEIATLAYSYWVARGYAHGSTEEDWYRAERELRSRR